MRARFTNPAISNDNHFLARLLLRLIYPGRNSKLKASVQLQDERNRTAHAETPVRLREKQQPTEEDKNDRSENDPVR